MQLKLTIEQVEAALPRVSVGLAKYTWLQNELLVRDVSRDAEFQKRFGGFYRVRRNAAWRDTYFQVLERAKREIISFEEALRSVHRATGRVEASFASKLVATIDPNQPVIDSVVLRNLGLKLPAVSASNRFSEIAQLHSQLSEVYARFLETRSGGDLVARFQRAYPGSPVTRTKMLDLVLWQSRETA